MANKTNPLALATALTLLSLIIAPTYAPAQSIGEPGRDSDSPNPLKNVYFGEQHLHTQDSPDAYSMGTRNTVDDAYNFAKGKAVKKNTSGEMVQRKTPYDWCAVTDHAEYLGVMPQLTDPSSDLSKKLKDNKIVQMIQSGDPDQGEEAFALISVDLTTNHPNPDFNQPDIIRTVWQNHIDAANRHYEPGKFTTLIAFEWTSIPINQNLHRNVFFRDDKGPQAPFSAFDSDRPEDLWSYLETQRDAGLETFSISHNANLSNGVMFAPRDSDGQPIDARYAKRRALTIPRWGRRC